jgi:hypothetical protein
MHAAYTTLLLLLQRTENSQNKKRIDYNSRKKVFEDRDADAWITSYEIVFLLSITEHNSQKLDSVPKHGHTYLIAFYAWG